MFEYMLTILFYINNYKSITFFKIKTDIKNYQVYRNLMNFIKK